MDGEETITLHVKAKDAKVKADRERTVGRVRDYFDHQFDITTDLKVLCFFDDEDMPSLGPDNRGVYWPVKGSSSEWPWPDYVKDLLVIQDMDSFVLRLRFASLIYLHGSTCESEVGMTLTFAHELQHFLQYANMRRLWAANTLLMNLEKHFPYKTKFNFLWDIPIEVEARLVAKRVGKSLHGPERVAQYVDERISNRVTDNDAMDWQFFRGLQSADPYDLLAKTKSLVQKYKPLLQLLQAYRDYTDDPDFSTIDFNKVSWWE